MDSSEKKRILIFIVAYNAERLIEKVVERIPQSLSAFDTHILIIDDSSTDGTFERVRSIAATPFPMTVLHNPVNQGYGGNQKIGFHFAIKEKYDFVALLHGDGQYAPECLPDLLEPLIRGEADAVFGSRMIGKTGARQGGMPVYKYLGNRILTAIQNRLLKTNLSEFHSGYRVYSVKVLESIPFERNTNDFPFDTDIIIQLVRGGFRIREIPIPTYYGDEICHVNGIKYGWDVIKATLIASTQDLGIFYQRKFDVRRADQGNPLYQSKWGYKSTHTMAVDRVRPRSKVLDLGCASGYVSRALADRGCEVTGIDLYPPPPDAGVVRFFRADLGADQLPVDPGEFDHVLMLDIIEHLPSPEGFLDRLRAACRANGDTRIVVTTGNVAFLGTRMMLLLGSFNYGIRGILDLTHTRLFTFASMRELFEQAGFAIEEVRGVPAPFPLAIGDNFWTRLAVAINSGLIFLSKGLFSFQILITARPLPTLESLLERAENSAADKTSTMASH